ncbi:hypothetical protein K1719_035831 [Acacia pycnantha]|nr:hypothetical protein K1719_035831 [Acacia pycnantha]
MKIEETVKLISTEGFEFVVDREAAMVSQAIHNMLTSPGSFAERQRGEVKMDRGDGQARMEPPANENGEATTEATTVLSLTLLINRCSFYLDSLKQQQKQRQSSINQNLLDNQNGNESQNADASDLEPHGGLLTFCRDLAMILSCCYCCFCCGVFPILCPLSLVPVHHHRCHHHELLPVLKSSSPQEKGMCLSGMDKILQSTGRGREVTVTNDGATILKSLHIDNPAPAAKVLGLPYPLSSLPCPCSPSSLPSSQSSFRSSRAPLHRKRDKILQSTSRGREVTVTNDGATILKSLHIDNPAPAAKVLGIRFCSQQAEEVIY